MSVIRLITAETATAGLAACTASVTTDDSVEAPCVSGVHPRADLEKLRISPGQPPDMASRIG